MNPTTPYDESGAPMPNHSLPTDSPRVAPRRGLQRPAAVLLAACVAALAGCAWPGALPAGTSIEQARHGLLSPTGEYALPGGGTRLEFAQGMYDKQTYMLDFDAAGHLQRSTQVLTEANLNRIETGTPAAEIRMRYGRPADVSSVAWQKLHVWNYRFADGECVWFQVSLDNATQQVTQAGTGQDPICDHGKD